MENILNWTIVIQLYLAHELIFRIKNYEMFYQTYT